MSDNSLNGYEAEPDADAEAEGIIEDIAAGWPGDPLPRYTALTAQQAHYQAVSDTLSKARAAVVAQMNNDGMSYAQIERLTGLTRGRVQQLVEKGRELAPTGDFDLLVRPQGEAMRGES